VFEKLLPRVSERSALSDRSAAAASINQACSKPPTTNPRTTQPQGRGPGAGSDDDSDIVTQRASVIYDFDPQEEDEVAVAKGQQVEVVYEVGGWLQVGGAPGLWWGGCGCECGSSAGVS